MTKINMLFLIFFSFGCSNNIDSDGKSSSSPEPSKSAQVAVTPQSTASPVLASPTASASTIAVSPKPSPTVSAPVSPQNIEYEKEFTLKIGLTAILPDKSQLKLESVVEDSRCPENAQCIWAGRVVLKFSLKKDNKTDTFNLSDEPGTTDAEAKQIGAYYLVITGVSDKPALSVNLILKKELKK